MDRNLRHRRFAAYGLLMVAAAALSLRLLEGRLESHSPEPFSIYETSPGKFLWTGDASVAEGTIIGTKAAQKAYVGGWRGMLLGRKLDPATAKVEDWRAISGIGPARAEEIVRTRERLGGFASTRDLIKVKGIGEKRLETIVPWLVPDAGREN